MSVTQATGVKFKINSTNLFALVVTLSVNDNVKYLENIDQGFKKTISWNKCRSEKITQQKKKKKKKKN